MVVLVGLVDGVASCSPPRQWLPNLFTPDPREIKTFARDSKLVKIADLQADLQQQIYKLTALCLACAMSL
jgi:hypothetical protein